MDPFLIVDFLIFILLKSKIQLISLCFVLSGKLNFLLTEQLDRISASSTGVRFVILLR